VGDDPDPSVKYDTCVHNAYTYVSCETNWSDTINANEVQIRVQSNGMPNKCWQQNSYTDNTAKYQEIDFRVTWNPTINDNQNYEKEDFASNLATDQLLCSRDRLMTENMPPLTTFVKHGRMFKTDRFAGFSRMNIMIYDGLTDEGRAWDATEGDEQYSYDKCLTRSDPRNGVLYHNTISPCANALGGSTSTKPGNCQGKSCFLNYEYQNGYWSTDQGTYGGFFGLALDGHVIYGPYNLDGELWSCDDLDRCNGFILPDNSYGYASTTFFPYTVGCWGPGPDEKLHIPNCSSFSCGDFAATINFTFSLGLVFTATQLLF
jgi:hypothetical protein